MRYYKFDKFPIPALAFQWKLGTCHEKESIQWLYIVMKKERIFLVWFSMVCFLKFEWYSIMGFFLYRTPIMHFFSFPRSNCLFVFLTFHYIILESCWCWYLLVSHMVQSFCSFSDNLYSNQYPNSQKLNLKRFCFIWLLSYRVIIKSIIIAIGT